MVSTSYGPAYVRISGPKDAPALFLLHGAGGNSLHWVPNIAQLSKHFQTFALDTVGDNGLSVYHKQMLTPRDYADWLDQVVRELKPHDKINLAGISYGARLAALYTRQHPNKVSAQVLLAPAGTVLPIS